MKQQKLSQFKTGFLNHKTHYAVQSAIATLAMFITLFALYEENLVIAASLGSTAFTVFALPSNITARSRNVIGGQSLAVVMGCLLALVPVHTGLTNLYIYSSAVGLTMFAMAVTNTEHPPAAGTALGIVIKGFSLQSVSGVIIGSIMLALAHRLCRSYLRDLINK
jgi:CBS-domain-containing membrane protein